MNKTKLKLLIGLLCIPAGFSTAQASEYGICEKDPTLSCLHNNFLDLYQSDHKLFWEILNSPKSGELDPKSSNDYPLFLNLIEFGAGNAEFSQYYYRKIEEDFVIASEDFVLRLQRVPERSVSKIIQHFQNSMFVNQDAIDSAMSNLLANQTAPDITNLYFTE